MAGSPRSKGSPTDRDRVVDELFALPLAQFTTQRNARAKQLRADGDRALGDEVAALPKPSASAAALNLLSRHERDALAPLEALTAKFAAGGLDRDAVTALSRERRTVVAALGKRVGSVAAREDRKLGPAAAREVEATLFAAIADPDALAAVLSGRLLRALSSDGLEPVDLDGAVAGAPVVPTRGTRSGGRASPAASKRRDNAKAVASAKREVAAASAALAKVDDRERTLEDSRADLDERAAELQRRFDELERANRALDADRDRLRRDREEAESRVEEAQAALDEAEKP